MIIIITIVIIIIITIVNIIIIFIFILSLLLLLLPSLLLLLLLSSLFLLLLSLPSHNHVGQQPVSCMTGLRSILVKYMNVSSALKYKSFSTCVYPARLTIPSPSDLRCEMCVKQGIHIYMYVHNQYYSVK